MRMEEQDVVVTQFYTSWLVKWLQGSEPMESLEEEWHRLITTSSKDNENPFVWIHTNGITTTGKNDWKKELRYGDLAPWNTSFRNEIRHWKELSQDQDQEGQEDCQTFRHRLVIFQVWTIWENKKDMIETSDEKGMPSSMAVQVTAWLYQDPDNSEDNAWKICHLHETSIPKMKHETSERSLFLYQPSKLPTILPWEQSPSSYIASNNNTNIAPNTCVPSRRRHLNTDILTAHNAKPLHCHSNNNHNNNNRNDSNAEVLAGISIGGWDIGTSQGPIGNSTWFDQALEQLEPQSQFRHEVSSTASTERTAAPRQLALPEMVFPQAYVVLNFNGNDTHLQLSWTAMDFLHEWAVAHQQIPMPRSSKEETEEKRMSSSQISYRGVSVLETSDASLWKEKTQTSSSTSTSTLASTLTSTSLKEHSSGITSTTFHYDWTYSSPYCETIRASHPTAYQWTPLSKSTMPMHLLKDRTVPILLFDQLVLLEDDMHDNGQMQYTIKIRVMPTCAYILSQLYVRVDHVLIRVRETRVLVEFVQGINNDDNKKRLYRDVTWRECPWKELASHGLPTAIKAWTHDDERYQPPQQAAAFAQLLLRLPIVDLPEGIPAHAELVYQKDLDKDLDTSRLAPPR